VRNAGGATFDAASLTAVEVLRSVSVQMGEVRVRRVVGGGGPPGSGPRVGRPGVDAGRAGGVSLCAAFSAPGRRGTGLVGSAARGEAATDPVVRRAGGGGGQRITTRTACCGDCPVAAVGGLLALSGPIPARRSSGVSNSRPAPPPADPRRVLWPRRGPKLPGN